MEDSYCIYLEHYRLGLLGSAGPALPVKSAQDELAAAFGVLDSKCLRPDGSQCGPDRYPDFKSRIGIHLK